MEEFVKYSVNSESITAGLAYMSSDANMKMNDDFMEGLDGIVTDEDKRSFMYFQKHGNESSGH